LLSVGIGPQDFRGGHLDLENTGPLGTGEEGGHFRRKGGYDPIKTWGQFKKRPRKKKQRNTDEK